MIPAGARGIQVGQVLAHPEAARGKLGLIEGQPALWRYRSRLHRWLEPTATVGTVSTVGAVLFSAPRLHAPSEPEQPSQGDQVGDDQEKVKRHRSTGRYRIPAPVSRPRHNGPQIAGGYAVKGMRRFLVPGLITLAAVALLAALASGVADQGTNSSIDAQVARGHYPLAPGLHQQLPLLGVHGQESLAALHGKVVLVNVFASWCTACATESPLLERAQRMLQRHDGTVLGVTYLDAASDSESFMRQRHLTYPVVRDVNGNFVRSYGVDGVPETFVINRTGHVQALNRAQLTAQWLNQTLPKIVGKSS